MLHFFKCPEDGINCSCSRGKQTAASSRNLFHDFISMHLFFLEQPKYQNSNMSRFNRFPKGGRLVAYRCISLQVISRQTQIYLCPDSQLCSSIRRRTSDKTHLFCETE